jgi:signal transduction histidine kinase
LVERTVDNLLDEGSVAFQAEGRLLQELGERLVASPEVALVELIKNAYDADSPSCEVTITESGKALVISDKGQGMTFQDFVGKWMRIATTSKIEERLSRKFRRRLTGAKGIGRFAVRYLGDHLTLVTIAEDPERHVRTRLTAKFDWPAIDRLNDLRQAKVEYTLEQMAEDSETGTTLEVQKLKASADFTSESSLRADVLRIVTPLQGLDPGRFRQIYGGAKTDPGFRVILPGTEAEGTTEVDLAELVLRNYWARLQIELSGKTLTFKVLFSSPRPPKTLEVEVGNAISAGFVADIRYFPRRKGVFQGKGVKGQAAWRWVRDNHGVAVVDHGFRIVPYGDEDDDWLNLSIDKAHSERDWRSTIGRKHFPIPAAVRNRPADNPALYLPYDYQLVGAVFVESKPPTSGKSENDLVPSMDREGFLKNKGFDELVEFVRAGIEFLALQDKRELDRLAAKEAREAAASAKADVQLAIEFVQQSPTLTAGDKARITKVYRQLADRIDQVEELNIQARRSLTTMSLLGVVAAFMTHENKSLVFEMERAIKQISSLAKKHPGLREISAGLNAHLSTFKGQLQYVQMFLAGVRKTDAARMSASGQIRHVLNRFESFATEHGVEVTTDAPPQTQTPALSPAMYSGVLLNLYSNALKAVLSVFSSIRHPKIAIRSWNERGSHYLEVSDNGAGIPIELRKRIWEPLYTTTSDTGNPLGSGMGLGLTLVKQVVEDAGGRITLADDAPPGFNTCFRVVFPLE